MSGDAPIAFFSYCREDSDFAMRLAQDLKTAGAPVWLDRLDIKPGQWWDKSVEQALNECPRMLVILSPASVNSKNVLDEVSFALEEQKTVLPILYRECHIPFRLRRVQYVDFTADYASALKQLLAALSSQPVPTTEIIQAAMVKEALAAEGARHEQEVHQPPDKAQPQEPQRQSTAAEQAHAEEERQRIAAEQARLDQEQKKAAAEKARQQELERQAAEEKSKQADTDRQAITAERVRLEQERQRLAAEQARLDEERKQSAAEMSHLLQLEQERKATAEQARLEDERKQAAALLEQQERERDAAEERARREEQDRRRIAEAESRLEETRKLVAAEKTRGLQPAQDSQAGSTFAQPAEPPRVPVVAPTARTSEIRQPVSEQTSPDFKVPLLPDAPTNNWIKPALIALGVLFIIGLVSYLAWQRSEQNREKEQYAQELAKIRSATEHPQPQAAAPQTTTPSAPVQEPDKPASKPTETEPAKVPPPSKSPAASTPPPATTSNNRALPVPTEPRPNVSNVPLPQSRFEGTWRVDLTTVRFDNAVDTYRLQNGQYTFGNPPQTVRANGMPQSLGGTATISLIELDNRRVEMQWWNNGKEVQELSVRVSQDGNTAIFVRVDKNYPSGLPVTSRYLMKRTAYGPLGANLISGSWRTVALESMSEIALTSTYKAMPGGLSATSPLGQSYTANLDGRDVPYRGDNQANSVSLRRLSDSSIEETDKRDGKVLSVTKMTVVSDGKSMTLEANFKQDGYTVRYVANRIQ